MVAVVLVVLFTGEKKQERSTVCTFSFIDVTTCGKKKEKVEEVARCSRRRLCRFIYVCCI